MRLIKEVYSSSDKISPKPNKLLEEYQDVTDRVSRTGTTKEKVSVEKEKLPDSSDILKTLEKITEEIEKDHQDTFETIKEIKEISDLNTQYAVGFFEVSRELENWAAQRRMILKDLKTAIVSMDQSRRISNKCKIMFSVLDITGTIGALILDRYRSDVTSKVVLAGGLFGCLSLVSNLVEIYRTQSAMEHVLKELRKDGEVMRKMQTLFQSMFDFDDAVQKLFPYGINLQIAMMIQDPLAARGSQQESFHEIIKALSALKLNVQISLAVVLSNIRRDPELLRDKDFLTKVRVFSQSPVAEKWWKRMKYRGLLPVSHKSKAYAELNRFTRVDMVPHPAMSMLSTSMWHTNGWPTVGSLFLNSWVVFEAYSELTESAGKKKEIDTLQELRKNLEDEYARIMELYDELSPQLT